MTIPTFPDLPGLSFPVKRSPSFATIAHKAVAGNSTRQSPQPFAIYAYELPFEFLRADNATLEIQTLMSFYQARKGRGSPFHFNDPDDNVVVNQVIGIGDGVTTDFALIRTMVGVADPVQDAIEGTISPYIDGVVVLGCIALSTSQYGTIYGLRYPVAPGVGAVVSAGFQYNWLCCFDEDVQEFSKFQYLNGKGLWEAKSVKFSLVPQ